MNILYITNQLDAGGITSYVLTLAVGLKKRGHNIFIASSGGEMLPKFTSEGINFVRIPIMTKSEASPKVFISLFKLLGYVRRNNIEIVHSHSRTTQVLGCLLAKLSGAGYISTCHGFFKKRFSRMAFACWGKKVIAISSQVKEHLMGDFGVKEDDIIVIHNGIDIDRFSQTPKGGQQLRNKFGLGSGPVIGIIARLSDVKGHLYLIEAMRYVANELPAAQLLVVGEGKMKEGLLALVEKLGLEGNVFFVPTVADTRDALSVMDLFVLPSLQEGLGLALMEAMAAGVPAIGSDVGGIKSLIRHHVTGLLVKPADAKGLSLAILELLGDRKKAEAFAGNAKNLISSEFSSEAMVLETERAYLKCLDA